MFTAPRIETEDVIWQPEIAGLTHDVPIQIMSADGALEADNPQTHVYLGMGEGHFANRSALKTLSRMGIASTAVILPFHYLPCEAANIERTLIEAPPMIAQEMNSRAGTSGPVSLLGHSQNGGAVILSASHAPELFDHIGAWSPVGLTSEAFGDTIAERRHEFLMRLLVKNSLLPDQNPLLHPGNVVAAAEIFSFVLRDALTGRLKPKLNYGLSRHGVENVATLVNAGRNLAIFGGQKDPIFKTQEYIDALEPENLEDIFSVVPGSHSSPLVKAGREQLKIVGKWLLDSRAYAKL